MYLPALPQLTTDLRATAVAAPLLGGLVLRVADWRGVFLVLAAVGVVLLGAALTQAETLPVGRRRTGGLGEVATVLRDVVRDRRFIVPSLVQGIGVCGMF